MIRKTIGAVLASLALVLGLGVSNAQAVDNVVDGDWCQSACTNVGMGRIDVSINFDNTNCDAHSMSNCSGANGAKIDYITLKYDQSAPYDVKNVTWDDIHIDHWGDGTSDYTESASVTWVYQGTTSGKVYYRADPNADYVRRVRVSVVSDGPGGDTGTDLTNINPYGL
jgi:hypothetical protein